MPFGNVSKIERHEWLVDGDVSVDAVAAVSSSQWTNAVACAGIGELCT